MSKKRPDAILVILAVVILAIFAPGITYFIISGMWQILKIALIILSIVIIFLFIVSVVRGKK
ncbi:MAG: hypothetical protein KDK41_10370 [Leptospiraceae bacterium]|nr:hypothetical protein [Leptospiraceae bacterium]